MYDRKRIALEGYLEILPQLEVDYNKLLAKYLITAVDKKSYAKLLFTFSLIFKRPPDEEPHFVEALCHTTKVLTARITSGESRYEPYLLEQCMDVMSDYLDPSEVDYLAEVCAIQFPNGERYATYADFTAKAIFVLSEIGNAEAIAVMKKCLEHPDTYVREAAEHYLSYFDQD